MDPNSEPTGKTIFVLDEYYESPAGIARHWQDAMDNWPDLSAAMAWSAKGTVDDAAQRHGCPSTLVRPPDRYAAPTAEPTSLFAGSATAGRRGRVTDRAFRR